MKTTSVRTCLVLSTIFALVSAGSAYAQGQEVGGQGIGEEAVFTYSGGTVKAIRAKVGNSPTTIAEPGGLTFSALPSAAVSYSVPAGTRDTFVVTFSGECRLNGAASDDWIEIEVRLDGVALQPQDSTSPMAFCSGDNWETQSATFVSGRLTGGSHTVTVHWKLVDTYSDSTLSGWLDDWTLLLMVSQ